MLDFLLAMVETEEQRTFIGQFYLEHQEKFIAFTYTKTRELKISSDRASAESDVHETFFRIIKK